MTSGKYLSDWVDNWGIPAKNGLFTWLVRAAKCLPFMQVLLITRQVLGVSQECVSCREYVEQLGYRSGLQ